MKMNVIMTDSVQLHGQQHDVSTDAADVHHRQLLLLLQPVSFVRFQVNRSIMLLLTIILYSTVTFDTKTFSEIEKCLKNILLQFTIINCNKIC